MAKYCPSCQKYISDPGTAEITKYAKFWRDNRCYYCDTLLQVIEKPEPEKAPAKEKTQNTNNKIVSIPRKFNFKTIFSRLFERKSKPEGTESGINKGEGFVKKIKKDGYALIKIPISDIPIYYNAVSQYLKKKGMPTNKIVSDLHLYLRGICPICRTWVNCDILFNVFLISIEGKDNVTMTRYGIISHLRDGICPNDRCLSKEIVIIWKGPPEVVNIVDSSLQRIVSEHKETSPVREALIPDVTAYIIDTITIQIERLRSETEPMELYASREFSEKKLWVWVSVISGCTDESSLKKRFFPAGYCEFFNDLMRKSNYDIGDVSVMHWIYTMHSNITKLHLCFVANKSQTGQPEKQKGSVILPTDLLNEEERKQLKI